MDPQFFEMYRKTLDKLVNNYFKILSYPQTDHLFTSLAAQDQLIEDVCLWSEAVASRSGRDAACSHVRGEGTARLSESG